MFIPAALGTLIALLIAPRREFWYLLSAAFVSGALIYAQVPPTVYWFFVPAYIVAVAFHFIRIEEKASVVEMFLLILAGLLVWLSDNSIITAVFTALAKVLADVLAAVFAELVNVLGLAVSGAVAAATGAALAWTYLAHRIERVAEEQPFTALALLFLGWLAVNLSIRAVYDAAVGVSDVVATALNAVYVAATFVGLYRLYDAFRGKPEAAIDAAVAVPFLSAVLSSLWPQLAQLIAAFVVLDIAFAALERRLRITAIVLAFALSVAA